MKTKIYTMIYKIETSNPNNPELLILGDEFVQNNHNKGNLIIKNKKFNLLKNKITITKIKKNQLKIKLILKDNIFNKSYMFSNCKSLLSISLNDEKDNKNLSLFLEKCDDNIFVYEEKENIIDSLINNSIVQNRDFNYTFDISQNDFNSNLNSW